MVILKFLFDIRKFVVLFFVIALCAGCSKDSKSLFTTVLGTSIGSTVGASLSKDKKKGAMIGAVVGGVAGTAASIAMGGGVISIAYGAVTTLGSVLVNHFAYKKKRKNEKNIKTNDIKEDLKQVDAKGVKSNCTIEK
ncbi:MAG: hypothetical protein V1646_02620 [bacterium]